MLLFNLVGNILFLDVKLMLGLILWVLIFWLVDSFSVVSVNFGRFWCIDILYCVLGWVVVKYVIFLLFEVI